MQGRKEFVDKVVPRFRLSERVSRQNPCRRLSELLNWVLFCPQTQAPYSHAGQPLLGPVGFFNLLLVSRLESTELPLLPARPPLGTPGRLVAQ